MLKHTALRREQGDTATPWSNHDRLVVMLIPLHDHLPYPDGNQILIHTDEPCASLKGASMTSPETGELIINDGHRIVSLCVRDAMTQENPLLVTFDSLDRALDLATTKSTPTHRLARKIRRLFSPSVFESRATAPPSTLVKSTIVEAVTVMKGGLSAEDALSEAFDLSMDCLRDFYRAYRWRARAPVLAPDRDAVASIIFWTTRGIGASGVDEGWSVFQVNRGSGRLVERETLDDGQRAEVADSLHLMLAGHPAPAIVESHLEADVAARVGDYSTAVVKAATAVETLLDSVLTLMLWEEGADPLDCACTVKPYFKARLRTHFHERLGGDWSMTQGEHPLTRWLHDAAQLRHRVVHRGYRPSAAECQRSLDSLDAVHEFVSQRLIEHLQTYFRTCVAVIGTPGLADRGLLSDEIDARLAAEGYDWVDSYRDWADAFYSARYARE